MRDLSKTLKQEIRDYICAVQCLPVCSEVLVRPVYLGVCGWNRSLVMRALSVVVIEAKTSPSNLDHLKLLQDVTFLLPVLDYFYSSESQTV